MPKQTEQQVGDEQATERREQAAKTVEAENAAIAASAVDPSAPASVHTMSQDERRAAADRHMAAEHAHADHERRMSIINTGTGEPPASPTPTWHPLDVPQPQTARPVEPTPHTVPFDAQR